VQQATGASPGSSARRRRTIYSRPRSMKPRSPDPDGDEAREGQRARSS
jgi:hypothetical protein